MTTVMCSRCQLPFKLTRGYVRFHGLPSGGVCPGSGLAPWVDILRPWVEVGV